MERIKLNNADDNSNANPNAMTTTQMEDRD